MRGPLSMQCFFLLISYEVFLLLSLQSLIPSANIDSYHVAATIRGAEDTAMSKIDINPCLCGMYVAVRTVRSQTLNEINKQRV